MYGYGILTWYGYLRLGHSLFFSPLVTFLSCSIGAYPISFHLVNGVLVFSLVIYWHFLDITLRHTKAYPFVFRDWDVWFLAYSNHLMAFSCSYWGIHLLSLCYYAWLVLFLGFSVLAPTLLRYSPRFYPFPDTHPDPSPILTMILPLSRYSPGPFSGTHPDSTPFPVLAQIGSLL